jgi:stage II sporulation protein D
MILIPLISVKRGRDNLISAFSFSSGEPSKKENSVVNNPGNKSFCVLDESTGKVVKISDKEFLYGAVASEMPAKFEEEALKAQAVACYTYFCKARGDFKNAGQKDKKYEFTINSEKGINYITTEVMKTRWGNSFDQNYSKIKDAVDSVFGEVLEEDGNLIFAAYHAISSGKTERSSDVFGGDLDYLVNVESPGDKLVSGYETHVEVTSGDFKNVLSQEWKDCVFDGGYFSWIGDLTRSQGGMVKEINICSHVAKGTEIRKMFALRSSNFDLKYDSNSDKFVFTVRGYGHGVGMSQYGAEYMAKEGADYKKILNWYYPNTTVAKL